MLPIRAGDRARTGDPQLGKLMLYQLSYARAPDGQGCRLSLAPGWRATFRNRTGDPVITSDVLYHLS